MLHLTPKQVEAINRLIVHEEDMLTIEGDPDVAMVVRVTVWYKDGSYLRVQVKQDGSRRNV